MLRLIVILAVIPDISFSQDLTDVEDIHILSELSLDKLLALKKTFKIQDSIADVNVSRTFEEESPQALALQSKKGPKDRGSYYQPQYHTESYEKDDDKNGIQKIFQISVTTLAFLAFGSYLLCLLIQAIKGKNDSNMQMAQTMANYLKNSIRAANVRRPQRLPKRRRQKQPHQSNRKPNKNNNVKIRPKREIFENEITDDMYYSLIDLSEAYVKYHTVDYLNLNSSYNF